MRKILRQSLPMKDQAAKLLLFTIAVTSSCTPALHLHEGDQFQLPYASSASPQATNLDALSPSEKIVVKRCGNTAHDYNDMQNLKPVFDQLIRDAEEKSNATILKDVVITVKKSKCVELSAIPLKTL